MSRIEVSKINSNIATGHTGSIQVAKLNVFLVLSPGEAGEDTSGRQGHVHTQIVRR
jgi:hypothetical protein